MHFGLCISMLSLLSLFVKVECRLQLEAQRISLSQMHAAQLELLREQADARACILELGRLKEPRGAGVCVTLCVRTCIFHCVCVCVCIWGYGARRAIEVVFDLSFMISTMLQTVDRKQDTDSQVIQSLLLSSYFSN